MELVEFKDLSKNFGTKEVLKKINLKIEKGKIYGLLGPNGSGKTTMIKIINDLLQPSSGEILIQGKEPGIESKKIISYLPERTYLNMNMKVIELIQFFKDFYQDFDEEKAVQLLEKLKINKQDKLKNMSKGTKEKVQLIMVMSRRADLYILETILTNFNEGSSIIICTHLIADIEKILDQVIFINQGKIVLNEDADTIRKSKKTTIDKLFREEFKC